MPVRLYLPCLELSSLTEPAIKSNVDVGGYRLVGVFVWIEILWVGFWVGKLSAKAFPYAFQFLCGMVTPRTRKVLRLWSRLSSKLTLISGLF